MRLSRFLLLFAITGIVIAVAAMYYMRSAINLREAPHPPPSLPANTSAAASDWRWSKTEGSRTAVEVHARHFRQVGEPSRFELEGVELRVFDKEGATFNQVKCARAEFDTSAGIMHSSGEVEITTGLPVAAETPARLIFIRALGASLDSRSGKVSTDGPAAFRFDRGEGKAVGALYDPETRELQMRSGAEVVWYGRGPGSKPIRVQSEEMVYRERESVILLGPWSRLTREDLTLEAGRAFVFLEDGVIRRVEAAGARGVTSQPGRRVEYGAEKMHIRLTETLAVESIVGEQKARLVSDDQAARTEVETDRLDLTFEVVGRDSRLRLAVATGRSIVDSRPVEVRGTRTPDSRILRSDVIHLRMQPSGEQIAAVETHTPGSIEFLPNTPGGRSRRLDAERMWIEYGPDNRIRSLRAVNVSTRTERPGRAPGPAILTWSKLLLAWFDEPTGQLARLEQSDAFRYEEGTRRAAANRAELEPAKELITLDGAARLWDTAGATSADRILLNQRTGDVTAEGNVASSWAPDRGDVSGVMLSGKEPVQARAERMNSSDGRSTVRYEGKTMLWQGANRIQADWIEINRGARQLTARGHVKTQLYDKPADAAGGAAKLSPPVCTMIEAAEMVYADSARTSHYRGGVRLLRAGTEVRSAELRAHLADQSSGSQVERAYADGGVEILHTAASRTRKATAEHAEYYTGEEKVVLYGGQPVLVDSAHGSTRGSRLTWFANNDRLLVEGGEGHPSVSRIQRK